MGSKSSMRNGPRRVALRLSRAIRRLTRDNMGAVAVFVALALIPLIGAIGLATDTTRAYLVKSRLSSALDAAGLAGGRVFYDATRDDDIRMYFWANYPEGYMGAAVEGPNIVEDLTNETLTLTARATLPTTFMRLLNQDSIAVSAAAEIARRTDRLDVVLAMDMSGSMLSNLDGQTRIAAAKTAAQSLVNILFGSDEEKGLLKIGLVPWAGKVNVTYNGTQYGYDEYGVPLTSSELYTTETVTPFTHPIPLYVNPAPNYQTSSSSSARNWKYVSPNANTTRSKLYYPHNSPVALMDVPPTGWKGCVYARFAGNNSTAADAILYSSSNANNAVWPGFVPMGVNVATRNAPYSVSTGGGLLVGGLFGVALSGASSGQPVDMLITGTHTLAKQTSSNNSQRWQDGDAIYWDNSNKRATRTSSGNAYIGVAAADANKNASTGSVRLDVGRGGEPQSGSNDYYNSYPNNVCLETHASRNSTSSSSRTSDCTPCPESGITPLQHTKSTISSAVSALNIPSTPGDTNYYTNIPQGLYWAWEVLMPGEPFNEGAVTNGQDAPPRAIVLMTDGYNTCREGDAYQDYSSGGCESWRDQRLRDVAANIKAQNVLIYTIQFAEFDASTADLLKEIATEPGAPYYWYAPSAQELQNVFTQIANNLSNLRLSR